MNMNLKAVYFCSTNLRRWGKGYTVAEAKKNAGLKNGAKGIEFFVQAAIFNEPTEAELKNLYDCITVDQIGGGPVYYKDDRTEEDTAMINSKHVGWLTIEKNF